MTRRLPNVLACPAPFVALRGCYRTSPPGWGTTDRPAPVGFDVSRFTTLDKAGTVTGCPAQLPPQRPPGWPAVSLAYDDATVQLRERRSIRPPAPWRTPEHNAELLRCARAALA